VKTILCCLTIWIGALPCPAHGQTLYALALLQAGRAAGVMPPASGLRLGTTGRVGMVADDGAGLSTSAELQLGLTPAQRVGVVRNTRGLTAVRLPNGAMMLDLAGRYREFAVVRVDAAGRSQLGCVHGEQALLRALDPCAPPPPPLFEDR
jgi:hypothetical protein